MSLDMGNVRRTLAGHALEATGVGVSAVENRNDLDSVVAVVKPVNDAVLTTSGAIQRVEWFSKLFPDPFRVDGEVAGDELERCRRDSFWQPLTQSALR